MGFIIFKIQNFLKISESQFSYIRTSNANVDDEHDQSGRPIKWRFLKVEPMTPFLLIWLIIWSQLDIKAKSIDFNLGFPLK